MVVVPTGNTLLLGTPVRSTLTLPELSLALAIPSCASVTTVPHVVAFGPVVTVTFAGALTDGAIVSLTVIETVAAALVDAGDAPSPVSSTVNSKLSGPL